MISGQLGETAGGREGTDKRSLSTLPKVTQLKSKLKTSGSRAPAVHNIILPELQSPVRRGQTGGVMVRDSIEES
jgi:hypothetical protein